MTIHQPIHGPQRMKLTVDDFLFLDTAGVFDGWRKAELLQGDLFRAGKPAKLDTAAFEMFRKAGKFSDYSKTELLDGVIYTMNSQYMPHAYVKSRLSLLLGMALLDLGSNLEVIVEGTLDMRPFSLPEPDLSITAGALAEGYMPLPSIRMIIEVSDTTLSRDLKRKLKVYADVGIPEYWVVDLPKRRIHQFWKPQGTTYGENRIVELGDRIESATIAGLAVETVGLTS
jgi:Uma2 family endonuclease